jgi:hypothetical protein
VVGGLSAERAEERAGVADAAELYAAHLLRGVGQRMRLKWVSVPVRFVQLMGQWRSDVVRLCMYVLIS